MIPGRAVAFLALRTLRARLRSTLLTLLGVAVGVFVTTVMQSLMFGFQSEFRRVLYDTIPGVIVKSRERGSLSDGRVLTAPEGTLVRQTRLKPVEKPKGVRSYAELVSRALRIPGVIAIAPIVEGRAMVRSGTRERRGVFYGVEATDYDRVVEFRSKVTGDVDAIRFRRDAVILGSELAEQLGASIGSRVEIVGAEGRRASFRVTALFKSGLRAYDQVVMFANLRAGQQLLDYPGSVTGMAIKVARGEDSTPIARRVEYALGLETQSWEETNAPFFALMRQQNMITFSTVAMTVLVAGFGIANGLITIVLEKRRDIGILRALGLTARGVATIFVLEGLLMGALGIALGLPLGAWMVEVMSHVPLTGRGGLATSDTFVMLRGPGIYIASAFFALLVSTLASFFPSLRAARYEPVEIIRTAR
jgi:lipoprotein-releasing system permease protein